MNVIVVVIYRPNTEPHANIDISSSNIEDIMVTVIMGDCNMDLPRFKSHAKTNDFLDGIFCHGFIPVISKPSRVTTLFVLIFSYLKI